MGWGSCAKPRKPPQTRGFSKGEGLKGHRKRWGKGVSEKWKTFPQRGENNFIFEKSFPPRIILVKKGKTKLFLHRDVTVEKGLCRPKKAPSFSFPQRKRGCFTAFPVFSHRFSIGVESIGKTLSALDLLFQVFNVGCKDRLGYHTLFHPIDRGHCGRVVAVKDLSRIGQ